MKRHLYAAVLAAILAILCLAGLAVFIFVEHRQLQTSAGEIVNPFESDEGLAAALRGNRPVYEENTERESTEEDGSLDSHVSKAFEAARSQVQENRPTAFCLWATPGPSAAATLSARAHGKMTACLWERSGKAAPGSGKRAFRKWRMRSGKTRTFR